MHGNNRVNDTKLRAEPVWDREQHPGAWRAVRAYSAKRARRDQKTLTAQEERARAIVAGEKKAKTARFVKNSGTDRALDEASLARARSLVGLKGYVTNVPVSLMPATEVITKYHDPGTSRSRSGCRNPISTPGPCSTANATPSKPT